MTPTEDDYADGASSTTEYEREICCIGYLKILGESIEPWMVVMLLRASNHPNRFAIVANVSFLTGIVGMS